MVTDGTRAHRKALSPDVQIHEAATAISADVAEIKKRTDSVIENIGALRFALNRIELLEDLLKDARIVVDAHGPKALTKKIDKAFKEN